MHIYRLKINDFDYDDFITDNPLYKYISDTRKLRILRYRNPKDKMLSLCSALLARYAICTNFSLCNDELSFSFNDKNKPICKNIPLSDFNFSHSNNCILCAVSKIPNNKVGADVQLLGRLPESVIKSAFHREEALYVNNSPNHLKIPRFYEIWTKKEAYTKALGTGLAVNLREINTLSLDNMTSWSDNEYAYSVYSTLTDDISELKDITIDNLYDFFMEKIV